MQDDDCWAGLSLEFKVKHASWEPDMQKECECIPIKQPCTCGLAARAEEPDVSLLGKDSCQREGTPREHTGTSRAAHGSLARPNQGLHFEYLQAQVTQSHAGKREVYHCSPLTFLDPVKEGTSSYIIKGSRKEVSKTG
jgi:hypothetical protein